MIPTTDVPLITVLRQEPAQRRRLRRGAARLPPVRGQHHRAEGMYSYGLYSYGVYGYGLYSYGLQYVANITELKVWMSPISLGPTAL